MRYLAEKTTIPVPKVYCSFLHKNRAYIVIERIQGEELPKAWKSLSEESVEKILSQLKRILQELRSLTPPPGTGVESCVGAHCTTLVYLMEIHVLVRSKQFKIFTFG